ncbi:hypothetical protein DFH07DRAFT_305473 [Mycena maculata]|uniref:Uncharacterized protein n=1 Tax=Mycena maculata TaxID=230809 RepID=A0AAD7MJL0_9AGAR|nr:hypothetical protein DFH07DRAFT_305473 [Mycena maculata]
MPRFLTAFRLRPRSRRLSSSPRVTHNLRTKTPHDTVATVELDPMLHSIHVVRKPRHTFKRRLILVWKRLSSPARPRASRRFSYIPPDFDLVSHGAQKSKRDSRRRTKYLEALPVENE